MLDRNDDYLEAVSEVVAAYVSNNKVAPNELPALIAQVHQALQQAAEGKPAEPEPEEVKPAVPVKKSITPEYLICLDDGKKFKSLKRHLSSLGMTPDEYRAKWNLPRDYPMVAPAYAEARSQLAKTIGLGQSRRKAAAPVPAKRGGPRAKAAVAAK